ncbi:hypothetical protein N325_07035, partial [Colius striatus]
VDQCIPLTDPGWDPNDRDDYQQLQQYQQWIKYGLENAIPKTINWSMLYAVRQGPSETPSEFLDRIRLAMRKYTPLDPSAEVGQQQLISLFIGQSCDDIRRKLQKLRGADVRDIERLIEEAWKVFGNRESDKD